MKWRIITVSVLLFFSTTQVTHAGFLLGMQRVAASAFCGMFSSFCDGTYADINQPASVINSKEVTVFSVDDEPQPTPQPMVYATTVIERTVIEEHHYPQHITNKYFTYTDGKVSEEELEALLVHAKAFTNLATDRHVERNNHGGSGNENSELTVEGETIIGGHMAVGGDAVVDSSTLLWPGDTFSTILTIEEEFTDLSSFDYVEGIANFILLNPESSVTSEVYGYDSSVRTEETNGRDFGDIYGQHIEVTHQGSGDADYIYGTYLNIGDTSSGEITSIRGAELHASHYGSGEVDELIGIKASAQNYGDADAGTTTDATGLYGVASYATNNYGVEAYVYKTHLTGSASNLAGESAAGWFRLQNTEPLSSGIETNYGVHADITRTGATGGTQNSYGYYLKVSDLDHSGAGTHNAYGLYLEHVTGADTNYSIYSEGGDAYFADNVGIGTSTPLYDLVVDGNYHLTGALYDNANSGGTNGMVLQTTGSGIQWVATSTLGLSGGGGGGGTFLSLSDTPASFSTNRIPYTNSGGSALIDSSGFTYDGLDISVNGGYQIEGNRVLHASTTNFSTLVGGSAGSVLQSDGFYNTAIGYQALTATTDGDNNTAVGRRALYSNTSGSFNTANGMFALYLNDQGGNNSAFGVSALRGNIDGDYNTAYGVSALYSNSDGYNNTAMGVDVLYSNILGYNNTANGMNALYNNTGATNTVAIGYQAGAGLGTYAAGDLTLVGTEALYSIDTGAEDNTALGYRAGYQNTTGANNIYLGSRAGDNITTGSNNIMLGYDIDAPSVTGNYQLSIGNLIYGTGLSATGTDVSTGYIGIGTSSPTSQFHTTGGVRFESLGSAGANLTTDTSGNVTASSDERLKVIVGLYDYSSIKELLGVEPIQYRWAVHSGLETESIYTGFSAQNVQEFIPEAVGEDKKGYLTLSDRPILATVINALKEVWEMVTGNEEKIKNLEERIEQLEEQLDVEPHVVPLEIEEDNQENEKEEQTDDPFLDSKEESKEIEELEDGEEITEVVVEEQAEEIENIEKDEDDGSTAPKTEKEEEKEDEAEIDTSLIADVEIVPIEE